MNIRWYLISLILAATLLLSACNINVVNGSGKVTAESRAVSNFHAVSFTGFGELTLVQGETEALTIETDDNLLPYIKTTVSQGVLTIGFGDGALTPILRPTQSIRYRLTVKTLTTLELSGAGTVEATELTADHLALTESGAGEIKVAKLAASDVTVDLSGAGAVQLAGEVTRQSVTLSGLGDYAAGDLASQTAEVTLSGAGAATVWVSEHLTTDLSGAGTIKYYGSPQLNSNSSGVGKVQSLGAK